MILRLNSTTEMKNLTTGILCTLMLCFFTINQASAQNSWDPQTFMIRFDPSISQDSIDSVRVDYYAEELWVSPLTQTRLWHVTVPYPHWTASGSDYFLDVQANSRESRSRAGSQGGSGNNYAVYGGIGGINNVPGGGNGGPQNPNPIYPDEGMNCHGEMFTHIETGDNPVKVGVFDTGAADLHFTHDYYWHLTYDVTGYNYIDNNYNYFDYHGHGNHVTSTIAHLTNKAAGLGFVYDPPNMALRALKTFDNNSQGYIAEIIYGLETEIVNGMQIANLSWRFTADMQEADKHPLKKTLEVAQNQYDVLFVCAAGNDAQNINGGLVLNGSVNLVNAYPAAYEFDNILSVTTFNCENGFADFANTGNVVVDIAAPGLEIPGLYFNLNGLMDVDYLSGTSMSAAIVTATAAQLATHQTTFDAAAIKCAIMSSADYHSGVAPGVVSNGLLNSAYALDFLPSCFSPPGGGPKGGRRLGLDMSDQSQINAEIYPNPSSGQFELNIEVEEFKTANLKMINAIGQTVFNQETNLNEGLNTLDIELNNVENGYYILTIDTGSELISKKVSIIK